MRGWDDLFPSNEELKDCVFEVVNDFVADGGSNPESEESKLSIGGGSSTLKKCEDCNDNLLANDEEFKNFVKHVVPDESKFDVVPFKDKRESLGQWAEEGTQNQQQHQQGSHNQGRDGEGILPSLFPPEMHEAQHHQQRLHAGNRHHHHPAQGGSFHDGRLGHGKRNGCQDQ